MRSSRTRGTVGTAATATATAVAVAVAATTVALAIAGSEAGAATATGTVGGSADAPFVDGEVVVGFRSGRERLLHLPEGISVAGAARALGENDRIAYALPNYIARAAVPNDRGRSGTRGGWRLMQWNFLPCGDTCGEPAQEFQAAGGIDAIGAWRTLRRRGRPGAKGIKIAVLDTGIAYRKFRRAFRKSPDFAGRQFIRGHDFVDRDPFPLDEDGHGTHVAGTIGERTNNHRALTGLAHRAKLIPVRVLDEAGFGTARDIARGIRFATKRRARVINMSFEFGPGINSCRRIRGICRALRRAIRRRRTVAVAAAGNGGFPVSSYPARVPRVIGVGGGERDGSLAEYSNYGDGLDLVAPGGGEWGDSPCGDDPIYQLTFKGPGFRHFGFPCGFHGTSMAAAHVSGAAAMVLASGVLGRRPAPGRVQCQLGSTSRPVGGFAGTAGLIDVAVAVEQRAPNC